jgi:hypothetical protein
MCRLYIAFHKEARHPAFNLSQFLVAGNKKQQNPQ